MLELKSAAEIPYDCERETIKRTCVQNTHMHQMCAGLAAIRCSERKAALRRGDRKAALRRGDRKAALRRDDRKAALRREDSRDIVPKKAALRRGPMQHYVE